MKSLKVRLGMTLLLMVFVSNCATFASYIVPNLKDRYLRISLDKPSTEYRYYTPYKCGFLKLLTCWTEHIANDFDFTLPEDRKRFQEMGFECHVVARPEIK